jgi:hypothetical protein
MKSMKTNAIDTPAIRPIRASLKPEFIRLPKPGTQCQHSGLSRTHLNALVLPNLANKFNPPVRSVCLRQPGKIKGVRLIHYDSLFSYLYAHEETAEESKQRQNTMKDSA